MYDCCLSEQIDINLKSEIVAKLYAGKGFNDSLWMKSSKLKCLYLYGAIILKDAILSSIIIKKNVKKKALKERRKSFWTIKQFGFSQMFRYLCHWVCIPMHTQTELQSK